MLSSRFNESVGRLRKRFNISFWCGVYNVGLFVVMMASMVASAIALVGVRIFERFTGRIAGAARGTGKTIHELEERIRRSEWVGSKHSDAA